jgi:uncharacterized protein (TIGR02246 family)
MTTFSSENDPGADGVPRRDDILYHYRVLNYLTHNFSKHRYSNFIIRVLDGGEEAWMSGYWLVSRTGYDGEVASRFGCYFWSFVKEDGEWKIGDRRQLSELMIESEFEDDDVPPEVPPPSGPTVHTKAGQAAAITGERGRDDFVALADDPVVAHSWVLDREVAATGTDELLDRLLDDRAARELLARYSYALDAADFDWIASLFTDDAVLVTPMGRAEGKAAVVEAFRELREGFTATRNRISNLVVRVTPGGDEAWLTAYFQFSTVAEDNSRESTFGSYLGRLVRSSGKWLIADWRVFVTPPLALKPASGRTARLTMPEIPQAREEFDAAVNSGAWGARRWLIEMPKPHDSGSVQVQRLADELAIKEMLIRYGAAFDGGDVDTVMGMFTEDAVLTMAKGRFRTPRRIRTHVEGVLRNRFTTFNRQMNTTVRFDPSGDQAWVSTIFYNVTPAGRRVGDGHFLCRVLRQDGQWKIADLQLSVDRERFFVSSPK